MNSNTRRTKDNQKWLFMEIALIIAIKKSLATVILDRGKNNGYRKPLTVLLASLFNSLSDC